MRREKLRRLEHENRLLRSQLDERERSGQGDQAQVLKTIIDGLKERIEQLEAENRCSCLNPPRQPDPPKLDLKSQSSAAKLNGLLMKPVFAGSLCQQRDSCFANDTKMSRVSPLSMSTVDSLGEKVDSNDSLNEAKDVSGAASPCEAGKIPYTSYNRVDRLKQVFLSNTWAFKRSVSYGYDRALGFNKTDQPILDNSFALSLRNRKDSERSAASTPLSRSSSCSKFRLPSLNGINGATTVGAHPPPHVDAVVITKDRPVSESNFDEVDKSCLNSDFDRLTDYENCSPAWTDNDPTDAAEDLTDFRFGAKHSSSMHLDSTRPAMPDDTIEVDLSFRAKGSVDSESVSSFSVFSEAITNSDRSFDRSQHSMLLTPRSNIGSQTLSKKSFGTLVKKKNMFKAAANAMFSLCGP